MKKITGHASSSSVGFMFTVPIGKIIQWDYQNSCWLIKINKTLETIFLKIVSRVFV